MKHPFSVLFIGLLAIFSTQIALAANEAQTEASKSYIFLFSNSMDINVPVRATELTTAYNGSLRHVYTHIFKGFSATISRADAINLVKNNSDVDSFLDNGVGSVAGGGNRGGKSGKSPDETQSWGVTFLGSRDASVDDKNTPDPSDDVTRHAWILDTGIDNYYGEIGELNIGDGENFVIRGNRKLDPNKTDDNKGHGTGIAGIIAAKDNDIGLVGIAAGATVHPVRVLHNNLWGTMDDFLAGIEYVKREINNEYIDENSEVATYNPLKYLPQDIHVVNMSLTIAEADQDGPNADLLVLFNNAIKDIANMVDVNIATCAGNQGTDVGLYTPANSENGSVYTVASVASNNHNDPSVASLSLAPDSNHGDAIDFVAPGVTIKTLKPGGGTWYNSGCSFATPHVAGILLFGTPDPDPQGIITDLDEVCGAGCSYQVAKFP